MSDTEVPKQPATWRIVLAAVLDFFTAFFVLGFLIASIFGGRTDAGFNLEGGPAILLFAAIVGYFLIGNRMFGGTLWKHILKARR